MSKFVVILDNGTKEEQDAITAFLQTKTGWSVWHWMEDAWLVALVPPEVGAKSLCEEIRKMVPSIIYKKHLVMSIGDPISYWGGVTKEAWPWMATNWGSISNK